MSQWRRRFASINLRRTRETDHESGPCSPRVTDGVRHGATGNALRVNAHGDGESIRDATINNRRGAPGNALRVNGHDRPHDG